MAERVCERCGHKFVAVTENQAEYQLRAHQLGKKCKDVKK